MAILFIIIATVLWFTHHQYPDLHSFYLVNSFYTFFALAIIHLVFRVAFEEIIVKKMKQAKMRYSFKKTISILYVLIFLFALVAIWLEQTETILISYGLIGAGIAVSLQDVFKNFAGGIIIFSTGIYRVGDRVEINGKIGDVMDIGVLYTTMMEIGVWVDGNQTTGRLSIIPNSNVLTNNVNNFTKDHNFIWDEISLPITYESDWRKASDIILEIVKKETKDIAIKADKEITKLGEKYYLPKKPVDPVIFLTLTDNWINLNIRYVTDTKERRIIRDRLSKLILIEIGKSKNITIASETIDVTLKK